MSKGRIITVFVMIVQMVGCSGYAPQTTVIEDGIRHLGDQSFDDWEVPQSEGTQITYNFELADPGDQEQYPFGLGMLMITEDGPIQYRIEINGVEIDMHAYLTIDYQASSRFESLWETLTGENHEYDGELTSLILEQGFSPIVAPGSIEEDVLLKGENTITFYATGEESVTDYMITHVFISNDEAMKDWMTINTLTR